MKVNFRDPSFRNDPGEVLRGLRKENPVAKIEGLSSFLVSRHADCAAILASKKFGFEESSDSLPGKSDYFGMRRALMVFQNAPDHPASRQEGKRMLAVKSAGEMEVIVRKAARLGLQEWNGSGDFVSGFARPFAWRIAEELFQEELGGSEVVMRLTRELTAALDPLGPGNSIKRAGEIFRLLEGGPGCPSKDGGDQLLMLVMASTFTTTHILGLVMEGLLTHPSLAALRQQKQEVTPEAVEELFRFYSPVQMTRRVALEEVEVKGRSYRAGTVFWLSLRSANEDERVFENPGVLDPERNPNRHLAFGKGAHNCLGAHLARMQLRVFLEEFCGRFPGMKMGEAKKMGSLVFRGLDALEVD